MPELPEVETLRLAAESWLVGRAFDRVELRRRRLRWPLDDNLISQLPGRKVTAASRRGKYLLLALNGGSSLIMHFGMSGSLRRERRCGFSPLRHDQVIFYSGASAFAFHDPRRFGFIALSAPPHRMLRRLGIEPLDKGLSAARLARLFAGRRVSVKNALMNQSLIAGIGNIYACEALYRARLSPLTPAGALDEKSARRLLLALRRVLREAINAGGSTLRDWRQAGGQPGYFQHSFAVYGRRGQPCHRCGDAIAFIRQAGRASYFCPACQPCQPNDRRSRRASPDGDPCDLPSPYRRNMAKL